jgi:tRNA 2-thiouridine synthesizing protein A
LLVGSSVKSLHTTQTAIFNQYDGLNSDLYSQRVSILIYDQLFSSPTNDCHHAAKCAEMVDTDLFAEFQLDAQGLVCPLPLLRTKQMLTRMQHGQKLLVLATDVGAWRDIPAFCQLAGHTLLERHDDSGVYRFFIEKN